MGEPERLKLDLLGRFALTEGGTRTGPIRISAPKGRALLAYCAMRRGQGVSRDTLATLLWGDRYDKQARQSLRQCLLRLRANLGARADLVVLDGDEVALRADAVAVDALAFTTLAESHELADLERAAALYRGPFLADVTLEVEAFDEWARSERERLEAIAARVFAVCAERHDSLRHGRQAIDAAEKLVALDPLREDYQRRLLTLYARYRGREAALAHAKALAGLLKREVNADPEPATRALVDDIKRGAIGLQENAATRASPAGPTGVPVSELSASMPGRALAPRAAAFLASRVGMSSLAVAGVLAMLALALFGREWSRPADAPTPSIAIAPAEKAATDESWRPPNVIPGVAVDQAAFAARGLIPLIVLPFRTYGDHASDQVIAEQITDDLINDLSRTPSLRVISGIHRAFMAAVPSTWPRSAQSSAYAT
jgi:DNA-binding SARP family transcriptional activator